MATPIITAAITKGGVAKSTTVCALAQAAAFDGKKPLVVDLDAQANASYFLNAGSGPGSYDVITGRLPAAEAVQTVDGVDILKGSADLATLQTGPGSAQRLKAALQPIRRRYDLILIDTPPGMSESLYLALYASTGLIIPLKAEAASLQGLYTIADLTQHIREANPRLRIIGAVITQFDGRPTLARFFRDTIADKGQAIGAPLIATIRQGIALQEAQALQTSLYKAAPKSKPAADYMQLYKLVISERKR